MARDLRHGTGSIRSQSGGVHAVLTIIGLLIVVGAFCPGSAAAGGEPSISLRAKLVGEKCRLTIRVRDAPHGAKAQLQRKDPGGWSTAATKRVDEGKSHWRRSCVQPAGSRVRARLLRKKLVLAHSKAVRQPVLDTTAPTTTILSGPSGLTNDVTPEFVFSADEDAVTFECRLGPMSAPGPFGPCSGSTSHSPGAPLGDGAYRFEVRATDAAGNTGAPAVRNFTVEVPGCFDDAAVALVGGNPGDLSASACAQGEGGDAQPSCETGGGRHQWWSFEIPAGETANFEVSPDPNLHDVGIALFTSNSGASEIACSDLFGPGTAESAATTNTGASPMTVYVQVFALPGQEGTYTLNVDSLDCFGEAPVALEGNNGGDLSSNSCAQAGEAQPSCETGGGKHQWWSFDIPAGETATFTVTPAAGDDIGIALFTANSDASELDCADMLGPSSAETANTTNLGAAPLTVYVQIFALPGHEGPYNLNIVSSP